MQDNAQSLRLQQEMAQIQASLVELQQKNQAIMSAHQGEMKTSPQQETQVEIHNI